MIMTAAMLYLQQLNIDQLQIKTLDGTAALNGLLKWPGAVSWDGQLVIDNIDLKKLNTPYSGNFSGIVIVGKPEYICIDIFVKAVCFLCFQIIDPGNRAAVLLILVGTAFPCRNNHEIIGVSGPALPVPAILPA